MLPLSHIPKPICAFACTHTEEHTHTHLRTYSHQVSNFILEKWQSVLKTWAFSWSIRQHRHIWSGGEKTLIAFYIHQRLPCHTRTLQMIKYPEKKIKREKGKSKIPFCHTLLSEAPQNNFNYLLAYRIKVLKPWFNLFCISPAPFPFPY